MDDSMNVSRSGRIRKKSSKLADFESPDINAPDSLEAKNAAAQLAAKKKPKDSEPSSNAPIVAQPHDSLREEDFDLVPEADWFDDSGEEDGALMIDDSKGKRSAASKNRKRRHSSSRKPKITGFLVYGKERKSALANEIPDFASILTRLKLDWQNLTSIERKTWEAKAENLERKMNENSTNKHSSASPVPAKRQRNPSVPGSSLLKSPQPLANQSPMRSPMSPPSYGNSGIFKVCGTDPLDSAAHLKLLGESLSVIGGRLKEHEGQIAVSGSLSVLLDSLLCAMGPLLCLTQQVPQMKDVIPREKLNRILDNVAYVMPGL